MHEFSFLLISLAFLLILLLLIKIMPDLCRKIENLLLLIIYYQLRINTLKKFLGANKSSSYINKIVANLKSMFWMLKNMCKLK